jgi:hypothetical protein
VATAGVVAGEQPRLSIDGQAVLEQELGLQPGYYEEAIRTINALATTLRSFSKDPDIAGILGEMF